MTKIFADADEKYVMNFVLYGKESDTKLYVDEKMTVQASYAEALDACLKGAVVLCNKVYYNPIAFRENINKITVDLATGTSTIAVKSLDSKVKGQ